MSSLGLLLERSLPRTGLVQFVFPCLMIYYLASFTSIQMEVNWSSACWGRGQFSKEQLCNSGKMVSMLGAELSQYQGIFHENTPVLALLTFSTLNISWSMIKNLKYSSLSPKNKDYCWSRRIIIPWRVKLTTMTAYSPFEFH